MAEKVDNGKGFDSKFTVSNAKRTNERLYSSRENRERFSYLGNSHAFGLSSNFLNEDKLPDATSEKDLGNEYFKHKKFREAIECYSRSIAFSPTSVAFANRAMAYLKVKKFEEAEKDCTDALSLDDRYVKAYSRRITARKELKKFEEAMEDADFAVRLEPNNPEIRKQFSDIKALMERKVIQNATRKEKSNSATKAGLTTDVYSVTNKIQTTEGSASQIMDYEMENSTNHVISLEKNDKTSASFVAGTMNDLRSNDEPSGVASNLNISNDKKQEAHDAKFKHEFKKSMQDLASRAVSRAIATSAKTISTPTSAYQFEISWRSLSNDSAKQIQLLKTIPPSDLPKIFKNALSSAILIDIIRCIAIFFRDDTILAVNIINNLTNVPRFDMIIMCLSSIDKAELQRLWEEVFLSEDTEADLRQLLASLKHSYCVTMNH